MRLGQLARKLAVPQNQIVEFLVKSGIPLESGANSKLDDLLTREVVRNFAPERIGEVLGEPEADIQKVEEPQPVADLPEATVPVEPEPIPSQPGSLEEDNTPTDPAEVIRAPKVELQGLKVIGKIELPESKKKKTEEENSAAENSGEKDRSPVNRSTSYRKPDRHDQWKKQQEQKQHEAEREAQRVRMAEEKRRKEQRTQSYLKKVKSVPTKAARRMEEQVIEMPADERERPKTWFGRFLRWLTT